MATSTVTYPAEVPQPKQIARQGIIVAAVLVAGVGLGMLLDTGRSTVSIDAAQLTRGQQAAADRLAAQVPTFDAARANAAASSRLQGLADSFAAEQLVNRGLIPEEAMTPAASAPEHGAFTAMQYRDPAVVQQRWIGQDANLDPDVPAVQHGDWTPLETRPVAPDRDVPLGRGSFGYRDYLGADPDPGVPNIAGY